MPYRPNVPCKQPGCAALVEPGKQYCQVHLKLHPEVTRSAGRRGYNSKWQRESKRFLRNKPLCVICLKKDPVCYTRATVVDHIVPHRGDEALFWDRSNWQPLCKECHDRKTLTEDIRPTYTY